MCCSKKYLYILLLIFMHRILHFILKIYILTKGFAEILKYNWIEARASNSAMDDLFWG